MDSPGEHEPDNADMHFVEVDPCGRYGRYKKILGRGAFKTVYWALDKLEGMEVAWNQVKVRDVTQGHGDLERLISEVHLLKTLKHKNIIKFYNYWVDRDSKNINIITEIFTSGTLRQYRKRHKQVDMRAIKNWSRQILQGLLYLHSQDPPIIHRDLKCDNIFVNGAQGEVKIGDLGMAAILHQAHAESVIGTPEFMAPELYEEKYNELVDIYSFGMCLLEMMTFEYPYSECENAVQIYKKVSSGVKPAALDKVGEPSVRQFIEKCLAPASRRLSARELLMDPFLQNEGEYEIMDNRLLSLGNDFGKCKKISELHTSRSFQESCSMLEQVHLNRGSFKTEEELEFSCNSNVIKGTSMHQESVEVGNFSDTYMEAGDTTSSAKEASQRNLDIRVKGKWEDDSTIFLRLRIADCEGNIRNIHFPFDIEADTALIVASEMVAELDLSDHDVTTIAEMMDVEIANLVPGWKPGVSFDDTPDDHSRVIGGDNSSDLTSDDDNPSGEFVLERLPSGRKYWLQSPTPHEGKSTIKAEPVKFPGPLRTGNKEGLPTKNLDSRQHLKHPKHSEIIVHTEKFQGTNINRDHSHEIVTEAKNQQLSLQVDETAHDSPSAVPFTKGTDNERDPPLEEEKRIAHELEKLAAQQQHELEALKRRHQQALQGLKNHLRLSMGRNCFSEASQLQEKLSIDKRSFKSKSDRLSMAEITAATATANAIYGPEMHHQSSWDDNWIPRHNFSVEDMSQSFRLVDFKRFDISSQKQLHSDDMSTQRLSDIRSEPDACERRSSFATADLTHPCGIYNNADAIARRRSIGPSVREEDVAVLGGKNKTSSNSLSRRHSDISKVSIVNNMETDAGKEMKNEIERKDVIRESVRNEIISDLASKGNSSTEHVTHSEKRTPAKEKKQEDSVKSSNTSDLSSLGDLFKKEKERWKLDKSAAKQRNKQDTAGTQSETSDTGIKESVASLANVFRVVDKHGKPKSLIKAYTNGFCHKHKPGLDQRDPKACEQCSSKSVPSNLPKTKGNRKGNHQVKKQLYEKPANTLEAKTVEDLQKSKNSYSSRNSRKQSFNIPLPIRYNKML